MGRGGRAGRERPVAAARFPRNGIAIVLSAAALAALFALVAGRQLHGRIENTSAANADPDALPPLAREVFERLPDPLLLLDASGRVVFANKEMANAVGTDPARKPISAVLRMPAVLQAIERTVETGEPARGRVRHSRAGRAAL